MGSQRKRVTAGAGIRMVLLIAALAAPLAASRVLPLGSSRRSRQRLRWV